MGYTESALSKLNKNDLICIAIKMQCTQNFLPNKKISELRKNYNKQADLEVSKPGKEKPQICIGVVCFGAI